MYKHLVRFQPIITKLADIFIIYKWLLVFVLVFLIIIWYDINIEYDVLLLLRLSCVHNLVLIHNYL